MRAFASFAGGLSDGVVTLSGTVTTAAAAPLARTRWPGWAMRWGWRRG